MMHDNQSIDLSINGAFPVPRRHTGKLVPPMRKTSGKNDKRHNIVVMKTKHRLSHNRIKAFVIVYHRFHFDIINIVQIPLR